MPAATPCTSRWCCSTSTGCGTLTNGWGSRPVTALGEVGLILQRGDSRPDFVARYGGDEFALILPETDMNGGRRFVEGAAPGAQPPHVSRSRTRRRARPHGGVAAFPHPEVMRPEDLFAVVEAALARGKSVEADRSGCRRAPRGTERLRPLQRIAQFKVDPLPRREHLGGAAHDHNVEPPVAAAVRTTRNRAPFGYFAVPLPSNLTVRLVLRAVLKICVSASKNGTRTTS